MLFSFCGPFSLASRGHQRRCRSWRWDDPQRLGSRVPATSGRSMTLIHQTGTHTVDGFAIYCISVCTASSKPAVIPTTKDQVVVQCWRGRIGLHSILLFFFCLSISSTIGRRSQYPRVCICSWNKSSDHNTNDGMLLLMFSLKLSFYQPF